MTDYKPKERQDLEELYRKQNVRINQLEQENKKLKEELKKDDREVQVDVDKELLKANDYLIKENRKLKEEIEFLEQCLDNKEKVNKSLREELEWYHGFDNYLTNHGFDMKNLKENIKNQN